MKYTTLSKYGGWMASGIFSIAAVALAAPITVSAATITVMNTSDNGPGSLRQAIADASPGDTINFGITGTISLTSGELGICKNLTIQGPGASRLAISPYNASPETASRVFYVCNGVTATLDGLTLRDGLAYDSGGGIRNHGTLTVKNSVITGNESLGYDSGDGGQGGGIRNSGTLTLINSTVSNNSVWAYYGGHGGGILNGGTLTIINSTLSDNSAWPFGGGIENWEGGTLTILNSTISGNVASGGGGIMNLSGGTLTILNSTVTGNTGGGIFCGNANETLVNTVVAGNVGSPSNDIAGTIETASHNLIGNAASSGGIQNGVNGNIVGVNPLLGPLQNNGGPTMTLALLPGSPAINAGDNCVLTANSCGYSHPTLPNDQRGMPRSASVDIGAFEWQTLEAPSDTWFDFDGDGRSDVSVFRPSDSVWYLNQSTRGFFATQFGLSADKVVPADFDGDGSTDIAVYRDGTWWIRKSADGTVEAHTFGIPSDIPVPADYTGDSRDELAVYRNGQWWALDLSNNQSSLINFGLPNDKPVPADFDGDGRVDQAVYRNGEWLINRSTLGYTVAHFGLSSDRPVVGDYDGDGRADLAVYRDGTWYLQQSTAGFSAFQWGLSTDVPTPGDYDGEGKTDAAVFRDGTWYLLQSTGGVSIQQFGLAGDKPLPATFVP